MHFKLSQDVCNIIEHECVNKQYFREGRPAAFVPDSLVSNKISSNATRVEARLCLSWVRKALVCAIDRPSQLQSTLPSRAQQEEQHDWICLCTGVAQMYLSARW